MGFSGCFGRGLATVLFLLVLGAKSPSVAGNNLHVVFRWKVLEYAWPNQEMRQRFPHYVQENNNPLGVEIAGERVFVTVPRWKLGVAATLNYIYLNDTSDSPLLNPYPSWEAHEYGKNKVPDVISVFRVWADRCGRLWVLDLGVDNLLGDVKKQALGALIIYDLSTDRSLRKYVIPVDQMTAKHHLGNVVVEDSSCEDSYAYLAELRTPTIIVYSWRLNTSWPVRHHFFHPDPVRGDYIYAGLSFQWWDGVVGLALAPEEDGFSTLYFHPFTSITQFAVSTRVLRDPKLASAKESFRDFKVVGWRSDNGQCAASYVDPVSGILFHAGAFADNVLCWRPGTEYNVQNLGIIAGDNNTLLFPSDIKVDRLQNIWVMTDLLPVFMFGKFNPNEYNFYILAAPLEDAIAGTACSNPFMGTAE